MNLQNVISSIQCHYFNTNAAICFRHMVHDHGAEKQFACSFCGKRFIAQGSLKEHEGETAFLWIKFDIIFWLYSMYCREASLFMGGGGGK